MSVSIGTTRVVASAYQVKQSNYNPRSRRNLIQFNQVKPIPKGEISPQRKRKIKSTLINFIHAQQHSRQRDGKRELFQFTLTFPNSMTDEAEAKKSLDKFKRRTNSTGRRRYAIITERSPAGNIHYHGIGEMEREDFEFWKDIVGSDSNFLINKRKLNIFKSNGAYRRNWRSEIRKAVNYILKGKVQNQGFIGGRLYYISKPLKAFQDFKRTGLEAVEWIQHNWMNLTKIGEGEFFCVYEMTRAKQREIRNLFKHIYELQINSP